MAQRVHIIAEGQTEERYVNKVLVPHLGNVFQVVVDVRCVHTGRDEEGRWYRGGLLDYEKARRDIQSWMNEEKKNPKVFFTTMFDLYALPENFHAFAEAKRERDPYARVCVIEEAMRKEFDHTRFFPYVQLHEFEALILADPQKLDWEYLEHEKAIASLVRLAESSNPEEINDGPNTHPARRIIAEIQEYEDQKAAVGPVVAEKIGLEVLRKRCCHFGEWIARLEHPLKQDSATLT